MTTTDCATDVAMPSPPSEDSQDDASAPLPAPGGASKPLKGLLMGFAATVTIGLALASWYVGVRIVDADEVAPASTPASAPVVAAAAAPTLSATAPASETSIGEAFWYTVPPANLYLQVAGIGPKQDAGFVKSLQAKGFGAQLESGDRADNARILIGPFSTRAGMEQAQRKLQSAGVLAVESAR